MLKQPTGCSVMECCSLLFFSCTHFPLDPPRPLLLLLPHISQNDFDHPQRRAVNLLLSIKTREQGHMNSIKALSFSCGEAEPFPQNPKVTWHCNAFWSIFCNRGCINWSLGFLFLQLSKVRTNFQHWRSNWPNADDVLDQWMISNSTRAPSFLLITGCHYLIKA